MIVSGQHHEHSAGCTCGGQQGGGGMLKLIFYFCLHHIYVCVWKNIQCTFYLTFVNDLVVIDKNFTFFMHI